MTPLAPWWKAAALHRTLGPKAIEAQLKAHVRTLKDGLRDLGAPPRPRSRPLQRWSLHRFRTGPQPSSPRFRRFGESTASLPHPPGACALSPHVYNTDDHIRRALEAVAEERALWA